VNFETCDARVLLTQIVGEFEEKTAANQLELIVDNPKEALHVRVDSRHIWRVFDNLLGNICKYAQPGTRVYISLVREGGDAVISFKNISKYRLNITSEELMERFVRGDSSRNTEGSGLGLSIAQSLTNLMNGTMELSVDGDLFKVVLRFPVV
jgi:signal transduction histidine kinase